LLLVFFRVAGVFESIPSIVDAAMESDQPNIKLGKLKVSQLNLQKLLIPTGIKRKLIVSQNICPPLSVGEMRDPQARSGHHAELLRCHDAAVASYDAVVSVDQDRVDPAELT